LLPQNDIASAATAERVVSSQPRAANPSPPWRLRVAQPGTVLPRPKAPDQGPNIGRRPLPLFSSTLLPDSRLNRRRPQAASSNDIPLLPMRHRRQADDALGDSRAAARNEATEVSGGENQQHNIVVVAPSGTLI